VILKKIHIKYTIYLETSIFSHMYKSKRGTL
jgi:hypothetical protein